MTSSFRRRSRTATRATSLVLLLLAPAACAPRVAPGTLAEPVRRVTNETLAADVATIDAWQGRLDALRRSEHERVPSTARRAAYGAAEAWLAFARDEYALDARLPVSDSALAAARRIIEAVERTGEPPAREAEMRMIGVEPAHPELWSELRRLRAGPGAGHAAELLGELEVELLRAGRVGEGTSRPRCAPALHLAHAQELLAGAQALVPAPVVAQAPAPAPPRVEPPVQVAVAAPEPAPAPEPTPAPPEPEEPVPVLVHSVHFALGSAALSPGSVTLLDEVIAQLRDRSGLTLVLEGHTDPRGNPTANYELSRRRAMAVRAHLAAALADVPIEVVPMGPNRRRASGTSTRDYALDRRVELRVFTADGSELSRAGAVRDLQEEKPPVEKPPVEKPPR